MYIHRVVIDANCINAKGGMEDMNSLEAFHDAGLIEILRTQTLGVEFKSAPLQYEKAKKYRVIGGSSHPDSYFGAVPGGSSRYYEYYKKIFLNKQDEKSEQRSIRDCLHIDQAILNNCNFFVTNEIRLLEAAAALPEIENVLQIVSPNECISRLQSYFVTKFGTSEIQSLIGKLASVGPILLGSNHCYGFTIVDPVTGESLLACSLEDHSFVVECIVRDEHGDRILEVKKGNMGAIETRDSYLKASGGAGPVLLGDKKFSQIYIGTDECAFIAARALSSGRMLFDRLNLHSVDGKRKIVIYQESMTIQGLDLKTHS